MKPTPAQHRVLCDLSEGDWVNLVNDKGHDVAVVGHLRNLGLIRDDMQGNRTSETRFTITPDGEAAMGGHQ